MNSRPPPAPVVFRRTLRQRLSLPARARILVAASGGADSTALALLLQREGYAIELAHLHHAIRPEPEAAADQTFVRALAQTLAVPFHTTRIHVPRRAARRHQSLEMAARDVRRAYLLRLARRLHIPYIATGHTADDQAETLLLRLARGTSITGMAGISPCTVEGTVTWIRPLLDLPHASLTAYLRRHRQPWCEDATNATPFALRNRVRHEILPLLETRLNPHARDALCRLADLAAAEDALLSHLTDLALQNPSALLTALHLPPSSLLPLALRRRIALRTLRDRQSPETFQAVQSVTFPPCGKIFPHHGKNLPHHGNFFPIIGKTDENFSNHWKKSASPQSVLEPAAAAPGGATSTLWKMNEGPFATHPARGFHPSPNEVYLSARAVAGRPLTFRTWKPGDAFQPLGVRGHKKLSDIFIDLKIPRSQRALCVVIECGGEIAALAGWRVATPFQVTSPRATSIRIRPTGRS